MVERKPGLFKIELFWPISTGLVNYGLGNPKATGPGCGFQESPWVDREDPLELENCGDTQAWRVNC